MSKVRVAIVLLVSVVAATWGNRAYQRSLLSPFVLGTVRAGMRFSDADDDAKHEMKHGYTCRAVGGDVRICTLVTDGPIGVLTHVVDRSGRVALIQFRISDSTHRTQGIGRRQTDLWDRVREGDMTVTDSNPDINPERWETVDSLWSAELTWRRSADAPGVMTVTDERRLRRIAESSPAAFRTVVEDSLLDRHDLRNVVSFAAKAGSASVAPQASTDGASAAAIADAGSAASMPQCPPVSAPVASPGVAAANSMEPALWAVAQQAIARTYPGRHLEIVGRGMQLIDGSGAAENVVLYPNASTPDGERYAFAVTFPQRIAEAGSHARRFDAEHQCRATSDILIARVDPATRTIADLQRVAVDDESLINAIGAVDFDPSAAGPSRLIVEYLASYGSATWYGQVRWHELVEADSPRIVSRSPVSWAKKLPDASADGGPLLPDDRNRDDPYGLSYVPGATLGFSTLDMGSGHPVRHVTLTTERGALPSGWALLAQL